MIKEMANLNDNLDAIHKAYIKDILASLPYPECETCDRTTRVLDTSVNEDGYPCCMVRVICNRECEADG